MPMKKIALLGSSGSIGRNCLKVVDNFLDEFQITCLAVHQSLQTVYEQALQYTPRAVVITKPVKNDPRIQELERKEIRIYQGQQALMEFFAEDDSDLVVNALVGAVGLFPTLEAIQRGKTVALANKETLVMAGEIITEQAKAKGVEIIPIDSEHSAIFQCLVGENPENIRRIILTASGGPFLERDAASFEQITVDEALDHPRWNMGDKVTIDSATLMNKGLEIIEAHWLFHLPLDKIEVVIHPQSIVHSMVEFIDGSIKAQLSLPDMKIPIQYALTYPQRKISPSQYLDIAELQSLTFFEPEHDKFPNMQLAIESLKSGGTAPAVLNAANEETVRLFLSARISFTDIPCLIEEALQQHQVISHPDIDQILAADQWSRDFVLQMLGE